MTEYVLGLIPTYGLYVIFAVVTLACLAIPLPASMLVLAAGSFAAAGDLELWQVVLVSFTAFLVGDQLAYRIAHILGPGLLGRLRSSKKMDGLISKSEDLLKTKGQIAVLLSHTVLSPTGPYVSYLCGAGGMNWLAFSLMAGIGAALWTAAYVGLGYAFADQLSQVSDILSDFFGFILAACVLVGSGYWLLRKWKEKRASGTGS